MKKLKGSSLIVLVIVLAVVAVIGAVIFFWGKGGFGFGGGKGDGEGDGGLGDAEHLGDVFEAGPSVLGCAAGPGRGPSGGGVPCGVLRAGVPGARRLGFGVIGIHVRHL